MALVPSLTTRLGINASYISGIAFVLMAMNGNTLTQIRQPQVFRSGRAGQDCPGARHLLTNAPMQEPPRLDIHSKSFLHSLMARQLRLSIFCAASFLVVLLGLPLANYFFPDAMAIRVAGFTLSWLILG